MSNPKGPHQDFPRPSDLLARKIMGVYGECPAFPGQPSNCDPGVCDCGMGDDLANLMQLVRDETKADAGTRSETTPPEDPNVPEVEHIMQLVREDAR